MKRFSIPSALVLAALSLLATAMPVHAGPRPIQAEGRGLLYVNDYSAQLFGQGKGEHLGGCFLAIYFDFVELQYYNHVVITGLLLGARNGERQRCRPDGITKHMDPPFARLHKPDRVVRHRSTLRKIAIVMSSCRKSAGCAGTLPPRPRSWWHTKCGTQDRNRTACPAPQPRLRPPTAR